MKVSLRRKMTVNLKERRGIFEKYDGNQIRNTWKVLKCGAGEGWKRSVGPIV